MLDIIAIGDYYQGVDPDQGLTDMRAAATEACCERFRRIDRFTQMALIGSAQCVEGAEVKPDAGLYIGSRFASLGSITKVHEQMVGRGSVPKPANFINTLSNSAGYFVARNLGLRHRNLFVSRGDASMVAALQLAAMDVSTGAVSQALVGVVEEAVLPLEHHHFRLGVEPGTEIGEGSHWLLVAPEGSADSLASITDMITLVDEQALDQWLNQLDPATEYRVSLSPWTRQRITSSCLQNRPRLRGFDPALAVYPGYVAGATIRYLQSGEASPLIVIAADTDGRFHAIVAWPKRAN
ncbi:MAG: beta-ketoacyl synthase N-terminal-like domain-containing protein [Marinobacter sp.]|uniref:beta-ketoacyl synthase N-terminal-like domain-containing protein n=1 Tax=Marinobacter sp. TaxID=50741 RepID=UPI003F9430F9